MAQHDSEPVKVGELFYRRGRAELGPYRRMEVAHDKYGEVNATSGWTGECI